MKIEVKHIEESPVVVGIQVRQPEPLPEWMLKIVRKQDRYNKIYETAHAFLAEANNELLMAIDDINQKFGTDFTFEQVVQDFGGQYSFEAADVDGDDD